MEARVKVIVDVAPDEVLVAFKRDEYYKDTDPYILANDAIGWRWIHWRVVPVPPVEPETNN